MNAERLLDHYERTIDAPDAIARLRRLVLDLAIRGKLVSQDSDDESASELLGRIAEEKSRRIKAGEARKSEVDPINSNEEPFHAPVGWVWTRLGSVGDWGSGSTPPRGNHDFYGGAIPWLKSGELNDNRQLSGSEETVTQLAIDKCSFRINRPGDVLIAMYGATIGKVAILAERAVTNQAVCGCSPFTGVLNQFLFFFLLAHREQFHLASEGGAQPNISKIKIISTPFPLPPLAEQHRIVTKIDELMALCDRLEAMRAEREARRDRLTAASLARLNAPDPETFQTDARFALDALPMVTARADQIKQLRQSILSLAVRGRLVRQDPNDEPASELLKRIAKVKAQLAKAGKVRDPLAAEHNQTLSDVLLLPPSWEHVTVAEVAYLRSGVALTHDEEKPSGDIPYVKVADLSLPENALGVATSSRFVGPSRNGDAIEVGSIVFPKRGGAIATNRKRLSLVKIVGDSNLMAMKPYCDETRPFVEMWFNSFDLWTLNSGTSVPQINNKDIYPLMLPLPPLAEQHRIVAKVDALMALCDRLEASLNTIDDTRRRLLDALLAEALGPDSSRELQAAE